MANQLACLCNQNEACTCEERKERKKALEDEWDRTVAQLRRFEEAANEYAEWARRVPKSQAKPPRGWYGGPPGKEVTINRMTVEVDNDFKHGVIPCYFSIPAVLRFRKLRNEIASFFT